MSGFICPYCGMAMAVESNTHSSQFPSFESSCGILNTTLGQSYQRSTLEIEMYHCPNCNEYSIFAKGRGSAVRDVRIAIRPLSNAKQFPNYIPSQIREDYEEACAILYHSPKASATLSRRCLQGMIRDYWGIRKATLFSEITALQDKIQPDLWHALNSLRQLGNIGAHMEKDVDLIVDIDPNEAEKLIQLIELLMKEWYINREERAKLFSDILQISEDKQAERKGEG